MTCRNVSVLLLATALLAAAPACKKSGERDTPAAAASAEESAAAPAGEGAATGAAATGAVAGADPRSLSPDQTHEVSGSGPDTVATGEKAPVNVTIKPLGGWKINTDENFPTKLTITAPDGVTVSSETLSAKAAKSFGEKGAEFTFDATVQSAGEYEVQCDVRFAVCSETSCIPKREKVMVALKATE